MTNDPNLHVLQIWLQQLKPELSPGRVSRETKVISDTIQT
jgi:hypothetical protein